jgi:HSP20 family protein
MARTSFDTIEHERRRTMFDVIGELDALRREIDRLFANAATPPWRRVAFLPGRGARQYPLVNLSEDRDHLYVEALMPGADPKSLDVQIVRDTLTLTGEKPRWPSGAPKVHEDAYHRNERAAGKFVRTVTLPTDVDDKRIDAKYEHGVLRVVLPKAESAKPRQINVAVAA